MRSLTQKQKAVLSTIKDFILREGKAPTLRELQSILQETMGLKSVSSVQRHLMALKEKGYLFGERYHARSLRPAAPELVNIPLLGNIAAGQPLLAQENIEAYIPYSASSLRGDPQQYFFLRAVGDSMNATNVNNKTIDSGDFVLVKRQSSADQNEKIVALIGDEATVKRLRYKEGMAVLEPESTNPDNKKLYMLDNLLIQGVVKDVVKRG